MAGRQIGTATVIAIVLALAPGCHPKASQGDGLAGTEAGEPSTSTTGGGIGYVPADEIMPPKIPEGFEVEMSQPAVVGELTDADARSGSRPGLEKMKTCYGERLARKPGIAGTMRIGVEIGTDGKVTSVEVASDSTGDGRLADCVSGVAGKMTFVEGSGARSLSFTVRFTPP